MFITRPLPLCLPPGGSVWRFLSCYTPSARTCLHGGPNEVGELDGRVARQLLRWAPRSCPVHVEHVELPSRFGSRDQSLAARPGQEAVGPELGPPTRAEQPSGLRRGYRGPRATLGWTIMGKGIPGRSNCPGKVLEAGGRGRVQEQRDGLRPGFPFTCLTVGRGPCKRGGGPQCHLSVGETRKLLPGGAVFLHPVHFCW